MYCLLSFDGIDRDSKICHGYGFKTAEFIVGRSVFENCPPRSPQLRLKVSSLNGGTLTRVGVWPLYSRRE